jgi:predicted nucleotidyltransferase
MPNRGTTARKRTTSLSDALFTTTQQPVLALLFGQPERSFDQRDLIRRVGGESGAVRRELVRLVESGLVTATVVRRQKYFQANHGAPIFHELRDIVRKTVVLDPLRAVLRPFAKRIALAIVYGSVVCISDYAIIYGCLVRGDDHAPSDIDLLVVADMPFKELFAPIVPLAHQLGRRISLTLYSRSAFERRRSDLGLGAMLGREYLLLHGTLGDD